jgi:hypothetical protein
MAWAVPAANTMSSCSVEIILSACQTLWTDLISFTIKPSPVSDGDLKTYDAFTESFEFQ